MELTFILFSLCAFLAVVLALEGLYNLWASKHSAQAQRIASRLASLSGEVVASELTLQRSSRSSRWGWLQSRLATMKLGRRIELFLRASGKDITAAELLMVSLGLLLGGLFVVGLLLGRSLETGLASGALLAAIPWWRVSAARSQRISRLEQQLPEALDLMGRALRAGHAFPSAIKMCGDEMALPIGREFRLLSDEMNYGVPVGEALRNLAQRIPVDDVAYFVVAVMIQRESGGNLAEVLDKISALIRERFKLFGQVKTLSAEGIMSAKILVAMPFAVALLVNLVNPQFMSLLWTDPTGQMLVSIALSMMAVGIFWMRSVVKIRV